MRSNKTWADVERAALNDPLLLAAVTMVRAGEMTREAALVAASLGLAETNRALVEEICTLRAAATQRTT